MKRFVFSLLDTDPLPPSNSTPSWDDTFCDKNLSRLSLFPLTQMLVYSLLILYGGDGEQSSLEESGARPVFFFVLDIGKIGLL